jgi:DNA-binding NarL/FixJ family response regulator
MTIDSLTPREVEVARLAAKGQSNKEITHSLGITEGTIKVHLNAIFRKLGVGSRSDLIRTLHRM